MSQYIVRTTFFFCFLEFIQFVISNSGYVISLILAMRVTAISEDTHTESENLSLE